MPYMTLWGLNFFLLFPLSSLYSPVGGILGRADELAGGDVGVCVPGVPSSFILEAFLFYLYGLYYMFSCHSFFYI